LFSPPRGNFLHVEQSSRRAGLHDAWYRGFSLSPVINRRHSDSDEGEWIAVPFATDEQVPCFRLVSPTAPVRRLLPARLVAVPLVSRDAYLTTRSTI